VSFYIVIQFFYFFFSFTPSQFTQLALLTLLPLTVDSSSPPTIYDDTIMIVLLLNWLGTLTNPFVLLESLIILPNIYANLKISQAKAQIGEAVDNQG